MVFDIKILVEKLNLPFSYGQIAKEIKQKMLEAHYDKRTSEYSKVKNDLLGTNDTIELVPDDFLDSDDFRIQNTTFFAQAQYFGDLAKNATLHSKPLLYHYAENSLFAFFINSMLSFPSSSKVHGLSIEWGNTLATTRLKLLKNGFFSRILDCYSILGYDTHFSSIHYRYTKNEITKTDSKYALHKQPMLTLNEIIKIRESLSDDSNGNYYDVVDFLLLFFASSLARYRPYFWHKIIEGNDSSDLVWFKAAFDRFDILKIRLIKVLLQFKEGQSPFELHKSDVHVLQDKNYLR